MGPDKDTIHQGQSFLDAIHDLAKQMDDVDLPLILHLVSPNLLGEALWRDRFLLVFGLQTGVQKNHFFRSLEGAKSLENL